MPEERKRDDHDEKQEMLKERNKSCPRRETSDDHEEKNNDNG
jgi:hypothetical protein